jgi:hypothetical protein
LDCKYTTFDRALNIEIGTAQSGLVLDKDNRTITQVISGKKMGDLAESFEETETAYVTDMIVLNKYTLEIEMKGPLGFGATGSCEILQPQL